MTDAGGNSRAPTGAEVLSRAINYFLQDTHTMLPGRVESYDAGEQCANVKPLIQRLTLASDGSEFTEEIPVIPKVPVMFPRSGEFAITLPIKKGDFVMLVFAERSIDGYMSGSGTDESPDDFRKHDLSDAVALPGFAPFKKSLPRADADDMTVGHQSGKGVAFWKEDEVHFGAKTAADVASLDSKVQDELKAIRDKLNDLITKYNMHIHTTTATISASAVPGVIAATVSTETAPAPVGATDSQVVFIDS